jgi:hypothetical protein
MDAFDYHDTPVQPRRDNSALVWNILTVMVLLVTLCVGIVFLMLFINPAGAYNPFPPPTLPVLAHLPTATPTPKILMPATWTATITPLPTETPLPTNTPVPTATPTQAITETPVPETTEPTTPEGGMSYILHPGDPKAIPNIGHPDAGCSWMGIAGQALGMNDGPVVGLFVQLKGVLNGQSIDMLGMTGTATQYGTAGYEFTIGDQPIASQDTLWVQLFDQAMLPLSDKIAFDTYSDCDKNLIFINFKQVK